MSRRARRVRKAGVADAAVGGVAVAADAMAKTPNSMAIGVRQRKRATNWRLERQPSRVRARLQRRGLRSKAIWPPAFAPLPEWGGERARPEFALAAEFAPPFAPDFASDFAAPPAVEPAAPVAEVTETSAPEPRAVVEAPQQPVAVEPAAPAPDPANLDPLDPARAVGST